MKTISLRLRNGWQALKDKLGIGPFEPGPMASIINENLPGGHGRPDLNENMVNWMPTSHFIVQACMTPHGRTRVDYFEVHYAVSGSGEPVEMKTLTYADDPDYSFCNECKLHVHKSGPAMSRHHQLHYEAKRSRAHLEIRAVRDRNGNPERDEEGRIIYYFGAYKDVSTGKAVHTRDGYKELYRSVNLLNVVPSDVEVRGPAANTDINGDCKCLSCSVIPGPVETICEPVKNDDGIPKEGDLVWDKNGLIQINESGFAVEASIRDPRDTIVDEAFDLVIDHEIPGHLVHVGETFDLEPRDDVGDLPTIDDLEPIKSKQVRFAREVTPGVGASKYFDVEFRKVMTPFDLVDGDQGELETVERFTRSKSDQYSVHRINTTGNLMIEIHVDWRGRVTRARTHVSEYLPDGSRHDSCGEVDEFFLPSNHIFFRHVNITTVLKGLI